MKIALIVAMAQNGVIGKNNELPWRLSGDLKLFKKLTMGHHMLMGRKTFESIGRALPGRTSLVLSRCEFDGRCEGVVVFHDPGEAIVYAKNKRETQLFITGGANVYQQLLPLVQTMYITKVKADILGDAYFPEVQWDQWKLLSSEDYQQDQANDYAWSFEIWDRVKPAPQILLA